MYNLERERKLIKLASIDADLTSEEEYEFYKKYALRTKEDIIKEVKSMQGQMKETDSGHRTEAFYQRLNHLIDDFCVEVDSHVIMEPLDNFWGYAINIRETGITLTLEHTVILYDYVGKDYPNWYKYSATHFLTSDDRYTLIEVKAKLLSLEEYGEAYGVEPGTVRQWIRRGKLRSASKFGNEWRVPELADKPERGYQGGTYRWRSELPDPPIELPDINDGDLVYIFKNVHTGAWTARIECFDKKGNEKEVVLGNKEKEKLELYLISHPLVECLNNHICEARQKHGSWYEMMRLDPKAKEDDEKFAAFLAEVAGKQEEEAVN